MNDAFVFILNAAFFLGFVMINRRAQTEKRTHRMTQWPAWLTGHSYATHLKSSQKPNPVARWSGVEKIIIRMCQTDLHTSCDYTEPNCEKLTTLRFEFHLNSDRFKQPTTKLNFILIPIYFHVFRETPNIFHVLHYNTLLRLLIVWHKWSKITAYYGILNLCSSVDKIDE